MRRTRPSASTQLAAAGADAPTRAQKTAHDTARRPRANLVPQGGLFWDGRADTLQDQAMGPLLNPFEMDGGSVAPCRRQAARSAPYAARFRAAVRRRRSSPIPRLAVSEAMFAVGRYQIEEPSFHPYTSKFDCWLEGKARLTPAELRGYLLFNDPARPIAAAAISTSPRPTACRRCSPTISTRRSACRATRRSSANRDPNYFDLGICGPFRTDMAEQTQYCGMFLTPTLRNVATRHVFFHNGVYHTLQQVMDFYDFRDTEPGEIYPRGADGKVAKYNDIPARYRANVDVVDPPFDRKLGEAPGDDRRTKSGTSSRSCGTLTDGYTPHH